MSAELCVVCGGRGRYRPPEWQKGDLEPVCHACNGRGYLGEPGGPPVYYPPPGYWLTIYPYPATQADPARPARPEARS